MIGRVTNVGTIEYTASYDGERLYLYEQSNDSYTSVEDEDILMAVFQIFKNKFKDEFDFEE